MKIAYLFGGDVPSRCFLEATVRFVTAGEIVLTSVKPPQAFPTLFLEYDLDILEAVSTILGVMRLSETEPEVYIWDEDSPEPEVAVFFRALNPTRSVLDTLAGRVNTLNMLAIADGCSEAYTIAAVNLDKRSVQKLIAGFTREELMFVDVCETGQHDADEPLRRFVVRTLHRCPPVFDFWP